MKPKNYVWSDYCDNPDSMVTLDPKTGKTYTNEEAHKLPQEIKSRLLNHCTKQGYWVVNEWVKDDEV